MKGCPSPEIDGSQQTGERPTVPCNPQQEGGAAYKRPLFLNWLVQPEHPILVETIREIAAKTRSEFTADPEPRRLPLQSVTPVTHTLDDSDPEVFLEDSDSDIFGETDDCPDDRYGSTTTTAQAVDDDDDWLKWLEDTAPGASSSTQPQSQSQFHEEAKEHIRWIKSEEKHIYLDEDAYATSSSRPEDALKATMNKTNDKSKKNNKQNISLEQCVKDRKQETSKWHDRMIPYNKDEGCPNPTPNGPMGKINDNKEAGNDVPRFFWVGLQDTLASFATYEFPEVCTSEVRIPLHPSTVEVLAKQKFQPIGSNLPGIYSLFVDGSGGDTKNGLEGASWGIATTVEPYNVNVSDPLLVDFYGGLVITDPTHPHFLGATALTNNTAELSGTIWTLVYIYYHALKVPGCKYKVRYDSEFAAGATINNYNIVSHPTMSVLARGLRAIVQQVADVEFVHIPAHKGDPYNEMADRICSHILDSRQYSSCYLRTDTGSTPLFRWATAETGIREAEWAFLAFCSESVKQQYPIYEEDHNYFLFDQKTVVSRLVLPAADIAHRLDEHLHDVHDDSDIELYPWNCMQTNAQTLKEPAKRASYEKQVLCRKLHVSGWQETRSEKKGLYDYKEFVLAVAPACRGQFAVELWFNKTIPIGKKMELRFSFMLTIFV